MDKIENITLQERIDAIPEKDENGVDTIIYIGSRSAYYFIGTKTEYERTIDFISKNLLSAMKERLKQLKRWDATYHKWLKQLSEVKPDETSETKLKAIAETAEHVANDTENQIRRQKRIPMHEKNVSEFKPVRTRFTKPPYNRQTDSGIVIITEGVEAGRYWDYAEYKGCVPVNDDEEFDILLEGIV